MNAKLLSCQPSRALKLKLIGVVAVRMTLTLVSLAVVTLIVSDVLHAQTPSWCAIMGGTTQCNYFTEQQCLQTLSGIGGQCILTRREAGPRQHLLHRVRKTRRGCYRYNCKIRGHRRGWTETGFRRLPTTDRVTTESRHLQRNTPCPLYPRKRTCAAHKPMSAKCQKRTSYLARKL